MNTGAPCAIGVDVGGTKIEAILLDARGQERWRERVASPRGDYDASLQAISGIVNRARQAAGGAPCTIGIGAPGNVTERGVMKNCNSTQLNNRPLPHDLEALLGQPVIVTNDANCLALSEATDGAGRRLPGRVRRHPRHRCGSRHRRARPICSTAPTGIAGEWGHNPLPWARDDEPPPSVLLRPARLHRNPRVRPGLERDHAERHGGALKAREIAERAASGDAACDDTLTR